MLKKYVQGGAPDQLAAARSILNDWNSGTIPYHTIPPKFHTSSIASVPQIPEHLSASSVTTNAATDDPSSLVKSAVDVGAAQYVSKFSQPFDLEGLFSLTDNAVLNADSGPEEIVVDSEEALAVPMEDIDADIDDGFIPGAAAEDTPTRQNKKRAYSPTPSIVTTHEAYEPGADGRRVKAPKPKRTRYNPNAPIMLDAMEVKAMASANPLNRKRQREEAKAKKRRAGGGDEDMVLDDDELRFEAAIESHKFGFKASGGAFAMLAEADVPLPEDEDDDL